MLSRINWKAIAKGFAWTICLSGMVVLMSFIAVKKQEVKCTNVKILIPGADNFIEREEIDAILRQSQGNLVGKNLGEINTHEIERAIQANPYIAFAKVYADMNGVISIQIKQRQPILRIINAGGQDYYIDRDGLKMPMSPNFTANVLVATGDILEGFGGRVDTLITPLVSDLYKTALFLKQDTLWDAQIEQIFVNSRNNDIELIPRVGNQRIILGNADSLSVKMRNLLAFYKQAMPQVGWDTYKTISVKYINQIVCEKNIFDSTAVKKPVVLLDSATLAKRMIDSAVKKVIAEEIRSATTIAKPILVDAPKVKKIEKSVETSAPKKTTDKTTIKPPTEKVSTEKKKVIETPTKAKAIQKPTEKASVVKPAAEKTPADKKKPVVAIKEITDTKKNK